MEINIANPIPHELEEFRRMVAFVESEGYKVHVERTPTGYGMSRVSILKGTGVVVTNTGIYPAVPNLGIAQIKADIIALAFCMRDSGMQLVFLDHDLPKREKLSITKSKLESCVSIRQMVDMLEEVSHEMLPQVLNLIEGKRVSGGRPSKRMIIELIFGSADFKEVRKPVRSGIEWSNVKFMWKDTFAASKYAKVYKSLDEFCTFASDAEVSLK